MNIQLKRLFHSITDDQTQRRMFRKREASIFQFRASINSNIGSNACENQHVNQAFKPIVHYLKMQERKALNKNQLNLKNRKKKTFRLFIHKKSLFNETTKYEKTEPPPLWTFNTVNSITSIQYTGYLFIALIQMYVLSSIES